jgi:hypothetical protein
MWGKHKYHHCPASLDIKRDPISKITSTERVGGVTQEVGPEFNLHCCRKKNDSGEKGVKRERRWKEKSKRTFIEIIYHQINSEHRKINFPQRQIPNFHPENYPLYVHGSSSFRNALGPLKGFNVFKHLTPLLTPSLGK